MLWSTKRGISPQMHYGPQESQTFGAPAGHRYMCSRALGPSCPEAQDVTWDKHHIITVILGLCSRIYSHEVTGLHLHLLQSPITVENLLHTRVWALNERVTSRPAWEQHGLLVFNLYTWHEEGEWIPVAACPHEKDVPCWGIITWIFSNFKPNSKQESFCLPHTCPPFCLIFKIFSSAKYTIRQKKL